MATSLGRRRARRQLVRGVRAAVSAIQGYRITRRRRLQERRSGQLHGAVKGAQSRFRSRLTALRASARRRRR